MLTKTNEFYHSFSFIFSKHMKMSAKIMNMCGTKKCKNCLQAKHLRKLGKNYRVKGKLWSSTNDDGYLCLSCISKLRATNNLRKMIMKSYNVCDSNKKMSKKNQVENCENLDHINNLQEGNRHSIFGDSMDETPIVKVEDEENYTDSELILIENRYECNQDINNVHIEICEGTEYAHSKCTKSPNKNVYKFNEEPNVEAQSFVDAQENDEIKEVEYLEDEYMDLDFKEDEIVQEKYLDNNKSQIKQDNGTTNNEDTFILNIEDSNPNNTCVPNIIPHSEEDILILKVGEEEPINELTDEPIDSSFLSFDSICEVDTVFNDEIPQLGSSENNEYQNNNEGIFITKVEEQMNKLLNDPVDSNCEPNCASVNYEADTIFDNIISQLSTSETIENKQENEDIIILRVEGHESTSTNVEMLESAITEQDTNDKSINNVETDDGGPKLKSKKRKYVRRLKEGVLKEKKRKKEELKEKTTINEHKLNKQVNYTDDKLKEAVVAIKEGRLSVTQAVLRLKINFRTFHKKTKELFGATFPRKEKKWDYRGYFREIVTVLNATNCTPFKARGNSVYCAYCGARYKYQGATGYTPEQLREHVKAQHHAPTYDDVKGFMYPYLKHELIKMDILDLECTICPLKMDSWWEMLAHLRDAHGKEIKDGVKKMIPYILSDVNACALCDESFGTRLKLEHHMNVHYPNYICNQCGQHFAAKWGLSSHTQSVHLVSKVYCDKCAMVFTTKASLRAHISLQHNMTLNKYICCECKKQYDRARLLSQHQEAKRHGTQKLCKFCNRVFYSLFALSEHVPMHAHDEIKETFPTDPVVCTICNTQYNNMSRLKDHIKRIHTNDVYYECEMCNYKFGIKSYLSKHQKRKHYDVWLSKREVFIDESQNKKYRMRKEAAYIPKLRTDSEP